MAVERFQVECDFSPEEEGKLALRAGDVVDVLLREEGEDWWYGRISGREGWFPECYGFIVEQEQEQQQGNVSSAVPQDSARMGVYRDMSSEERRSSLEKTFKLMIEEEDSFTKKLRLLITHVIEPIMVRDTPFKREFMQEYSIAIIFSVVQEIETACSDFLKSLRQHCGKPVTEIPAHVAKCFHDFAPTLRNFSQYTLEISSAFATLKKMNKSLNQFLKTCSLPEDLPMEQILVLPVDHYALYLDNFTRFVFACGMPDWQGSILSPKDHKTLEDSLTEMSAYSKEVDVTLEDEKEKQLLLAIQRRCKCIPPLSFLLLSYLNSLKQP